MKLILTCEHGGNIIPPKYKYLFNNSESILKSHRGYDPGALDFFDYLSDLADFKISSSISRLLVELNRSKGHPQLFSEFSAELTFQEKQLLLDTYYFPYRHEVQEKIDSFIDQGEKVFHLSIHSFTSTLNSIERNADIGILYDSSRTQEKLLSRKLKGNLLQYSDELSIRYNYPYLGKADGFTTYLRKKFPVNYSGIELEVNQIYYRKNIMDRKIKNAVYEAVQLLKKVPLS